MTEQDDMAERDAAGVRLLDDAFVRWRNAPPVKMTLERRDAWTVLLSLQAAVTHPGFAGPGGWGPALVSVGRQIQEEIADDAEIYATAERGWAPADAADPREPVPEPDAAGIRLMTDAYTRWQTAPPISVTAERRELWTVMMGLQVAMMHPAIHASAMGRIVESVGRQLQNALCDDPELYAIAEAGWSRAADVAPGDDRD